MHHKLLTWLPVIFIVLTSCHSKETKQSAPVKKDSGFVYKAPAPGPVSDDEKKRLHNEVEYYYNKHLANNLNGALLVAKKGNIVFEKYNGYFNIRKKDSVINEHTAFHLASLSKTFTAMAILKLYQENKLRLDDTISKFFPGFPYKGVTVMLLLNHRSGLPNYVYAMEDGGWDKHKYITNQDIVNFLIQNAPPGTGRVGARFMYCNTNYALLALIVEKVSGITYPEYLQRNFFDPLEMNDTYVFSLADTATAMPSFNFKGQMERFNYLDGGYGDKNVYSTVRDLLKWDQALYSGELFRQSLLDSAFTPYSHEKPGIKNYGLGWRMNIYPNGKKIIFHTGWWHGNNTILIRLISDSATIICVTNKYNRGVYQTKNLANIFQDYFKVDEPEINEGRNNAEANTEQSQPPKRKHHATHRRGRK